MQITRKMLMEERKGLHLSKEICMKNKVPNQVP